MLCTEFLQVWSLPNLLKWGEKESGFTTPTHLNTGSPRPLLPCYAKKTSRQMKGDLWSVAGGPLCSWASNLQPVIILCQCGRSRTVGNWSLVTKNRYTMFSFTHNVFERFEKKMALLKKTPPPLPSMLFWNIKRSVCVWPLHTTLPILQCDETFVLAWIETLFSYLMLWYKKMFFKQKTLHLTVNHHWYLLVNYIPVNAFS